MRWLSENWHRVLAHAAALFPLLWLALDYLSNPESYTFNRTFMLHTGSAGLILLVGSLACTPASRLFNWPRAVQIRRALGLYAFLHISLHLVAYAVWENGLDLELIWRDLGERRAMSVGLVAFLALIPLALTSTQGWQRRLGKRWKTLHRLVYLAAILSVLHFFWLDRDFITEPVIYAVIVGALLALRLPWRRWALRRRVAAQKLE
ncbi:MAG: sulfite oxidase heme-binding subunit YedZ [Anaerolineales bacterium]